ncbi:DUF6402 family protein, partial [Paenibacillus sp. NPDC057934]|uniref:DUF6402 family protein n=1 Tax=Paenibacillus sp. NPDC057934 TaxID=3346282 RepID=UPI0036D7FE91
HSYDVFVSTGGGYAQLASTEFTTNQTNQVVQLPPIDTRTNPNVFGSTLLEARVAFRGSPPDYVDGSVHVANAPALRMDITPSIRTIMRANGWTVGAACQDRWFALPYTAGKEPTDTVVLDILKMDWATGFSDVRKSVDAGFNLIEVLPDRVKIKERIKAQVRARQVVLPTPGHSANFGTKASSLEVDGQGHNFPRFNRYWILEQSYAPYLLPLDDFTAAVARCTVRYIALGQITNTGAGGYTVSVTELGAYILDSFDFKDEEQELGYWSVKTNDVARTSLGTNYTRVTNATYRAWRQRNSRGVDYTNFSDILSRKANLTFPATPAELTP